MRSSQGLDCTLPSSRCITSFLLDLRGKMGRCSFGVGDESQCFLRKEDPMERHKRMLDVRSREGVFLAPGFIFRRIRADILCICSTDNCDIARALLLRCNARGSDPGSAVLQERDCPDWKVCTALPQHIRCFNGNVKGFGALRFIIMLVRVLCKALLVRILPLIGHASA